jgi:hypothetical protein
MARMGILGKGYSRTRAAARIKPIPHKKSKIARVVIPSGRSGLSNASELGAADFRRFACPDDSMHDDAWGRIGFQSSALERVGRPGAPRAEFSPETGVRFSLSIIDSLVK